jgi:Flp pilus assembly pilin Flp
MKRGKQEMLKAMKKFVRDDRGMETVEYAVMTALIVAALVAAIAALSLALQGRFSAVDEVVSGIH